MTKWTVLAVATTLVISTGCAAGVGDEGRVGEGSQAIKPMNGLRPDALLPRAFDPAALAAAALDPAALSRDVLAAIQDPGDAGTRSRQHLQYAVSCALDETQSVSFTWTDADQVVHAETYPGFVGLETGWASRPLSATGQRWISACMAARTNYSGVHVEISVRAPNPVLSPAETPEAPTFAVEEGAFWGNIYGGAPALYACDVPADDDNSWAQDRDCAAGHVDPATGVVSSCGIIRRLGSCDAFCAPIESGTLSHPFCWSDPVVRYRSISWQPITVALQ